MNETTIMEKIKNNGYVSNVSYPKTRKFSENHVFDEEQSVKWNKEEVLRQNKIIEEEVKAYRAAQAEKSNEFENDVIEYLIEDYNINNSKEIANKIFSKAYSDGHSGGYYEVLNEARDLADFVEDILEIVGNKK